MIEGYCDERFLEAKTLFEKNINNGFELGGAVSVELKGKKIIDLWGGYTDQAKTIRWEENTIINVFSTTKGIAAICLLQLIEKGLLDLDKPVATYWPEFSENAKENIPVRYLFCHKSGLCGIKTPLKTGAFTDWNLICSELAKQSTFWEPGTAHGYHGLTYGYLIGELLRRIDGRTIGTYFREEIADPLDIDFWIGLPDSEFHRVSDIYPAKPGLIEKLLPILTKLPKSFFPNRLQILFDFNDTSTPTGAAFNNPKISNGDIFEANTSAWRQAEIPAANGHGSARSIAKLYGILANGGTRNEVHVLNPETIEIGRTTQSEGKDLVLGNMHTRFGLGFMLGTKDVSMGPNINSFGHGGAGGSLGFADPDNNISLGFVMNQMHQGITAWKTATEVADSVYKTLEII
jgi:CubicO group peptidase (beta-lactamase class C family)